MRPRHKVVILKANEKPFLRMLALEHLPLWRCYFENCRHGFSNDRSEQIWNMVGRLNELLPWPVLMLFLREVR